MNHHVKITVEGKTNVILTGDIGEHDIVLVGIHTPTATLATVHEDIVCSALGDVNLALYQLVTTKDNTGLHLPHKKSIANIRIPGYVLFHGQIKA